MRFALKQNHLNLKWHELSLETIPKYWDIIVLKVSEMPFVSPQVLKKMPLTKNHSALLKQDLVAFSEMVNEKEKTAIFLSAESSPDAGRSTFADQSHKQARIEKKKKNQGEY